jgi:hypothetical protein
MSGARRLVQKQAPGGAQASQTPAGGALLDISYHDYFYYLFINELFILPCVSHA